MSVKDLRFKTKVYGVDLLLQVFGKLITNDNYYKLLIWSELLDKEN